MWFWGPRFSRGGLTQILDTYSHPNMWHVLVEVRSVSSASSSRIKQKTEEDRIAIKLEAYANYVGRLKKRVCVCPVRGWSAFD